MSGLAQLQLETLFVLDAGNRIVSTREPQATAGPLFMLIRSRFDCAWAIRTDVSGRIADELKRFAKEEPILSDLRAPTFHAIRYHALLGGRVHSGPAFTFPPTIPHPPEPRLVEDEQLLNRHFSGWIPGEIRAGRAPIMAVLDQDFPVSVCFCARRSLVAAEAGVETAPGYRGRGLAPQVTAAWALAIRNSGLVPLYSTDWSNEPSLAVAQKLGLDLYAVDWSISD